MRFASARCKSMGHAKPASILVEVAYARSDEQLIVPVQAPAGATVEQVIVLSRIRDRFPEIDPATAKVGIFGKLSKLTASVRPGDRVEIYRPLLADPKAVRKQRAAEGKQMRKGGGDLGPAED
ncbi:MAG: RnfH family protein [Rhizobiaceae bacterium]